MLKLNGIRFAVVAAMGGLLMTAAGADAALVINAPQPIIEQVTVQPIIVSDTGGGSTSTFFGTAGQEALIKGFVNQIWAQAGIEVLWLTPNAYNDTFANQGTLDPRPTSDLSTIVTAGDIAGVGNADANIIDMYFVNNVPGFSAGLSANTAAGLAFVGGNGITQYVGSALPGFTAGQEVVASVVAHEIGHNLGLPHISEVENLMQGSGVIVLTPEGEKLNSSQISTALASNLSQLATETIPTPAALPAGLMLLGFAAARRRNRAA